ncbi:hypothetical protein D0C36_23870 [Mucilaginibacter conchicola]|uniref:Uncharacterized protein n=1 Tax=Mucilaginibacter conchicola TaxID=2303333 RepID=A0A372NLU6_9SPHI|nr:hypothetical protein D0C36_23870 [Mucilaginibacter conchicola]
MHILRIKPDDIDRQFKTRNATARTEPRWVVLYNTEVVFNCFNFYSIKEYFAYLQHSLGIIPICDKV